MVRTLTIVLAATILMHSAARADDNWPQFRGPNAAGLAPPGARLPTPFPIALPSPSATAVPTPEPLPSPTAVIDGILVEFRATARVYVEAAVDGKQVLAETLAAGTQRTLPLAQNSVVMRASNASAVDITVNGTHQDVQTASDPMEFNWKR